MWDVLSLLSNHRIAFLTELKHLQHFQNQNFESELVVQRLFSSFSNRFESFLEKKFQIIFPPKWFFIHFIRESNNGTSDLISFFEMKEKEIYFCSERRLIGIEAQRNFSPSEVLHSSDFCHEAGIIFSFWSFAFIWMGLHQLKMALLVQDDSLLCFSHSLEMVLSSNWDYIQPGWVLPSNVMFHFWWSLVVILTKF